MTEPRFAVVFLDVAPAMTADDLADLANVALGNATSALMPFSSTWDKDPRDLWQIPEAVDAWTQFGALADAYAFRGRLTGPGVGVLQLCEAVTDGKRLVRVGDQVAILDPD
jgi:hypothetical protein